MATERLIKIGQQTAIISFLVGTVIFGFYFLTSKFELIFVGYGYIVLAGLLNLVIFVKIFLKSKKDKDNKKKLLQTCGLLLMNIPIMLFYCWVSILLLNTMRITFTNSTQTTLTNINIGGCGTSKISKLEIGESETVWITINGDSSIYITYTSNGQLKVETVLSYVTNNMGQILKHNIGVNNKELF